MEKTNPNLTVISERDRSPLKFSSNSKLFPMPDDYPEECRQFCKEKVCELCNVNFTSTIDATAHYKGRNHTRKSKSEIIHIANRKRGVDISLYCKYCDKNLSSPLMAADHYKGRKHQQAMQKQVTALIPDTVDVHRSETANEDKTGRFGIGLGFYSSAKPLSGSHQFSCLMCNVHCPNQISMDSHLNGSKHAKKCRANKPENQPDAPADNLLKSANENETVIIKNDLSIFRTPTGSYYCGPCNIALNSEAQYKNHISGKKHNAKKTTN